MCEEEDSNLHGNYPTSTSTGSKTLQDNAFNELESTGVPQEALRSTEIGVLPQADHGAPVSDEEMREEALELLRLVAAGEVIERERAVEFARAMLTLSEIGKLALEVMGGGVATGRALTELAERRIGAPIDRSEGLESSGNVG